MKQNFVQFLQLQSETHVVACYF